MDEFSTIGTGNARDDLDIACKRVSIAGQMAIGRLSRREAGEESVEQSPRAERVERKRSISRGQPRLASRWNQLRAVSRAESDV